MDPKLHDYTFFDLETTGKKIIQIGALKVRDDQTVAKFSTYVNPMLIPWRKLMSTSLT